MYLMQCKVGYMGLLAAADTKLCSATAIWRSNNCNRLQSNSSLGQLDNTGSSASSADPEADERMAENIWKKKVTSIIKILAP